MTLKVTLSEDLTISSYTNIAKEFFPAILSLNYDACFVSDESRLTDFSFSGVEDLNMENRTLKELYELWDKAIILKIFNYYGIIIPTTAVSLIQLFESIIESRTTPTVH